MPEDVWSEAWARSMFNHEDEWFIFEVNPQAPLSDETIESLVLHELGHGLCSLGQQLGDIGEEVACNRIGRLLLGRRFLHPNYLVELHPEAWTNAAMRPEFRLWLQPALDVLPERERKVVEGLYFEGKSYGQLATELGTVKWDVTRWHASALTQLRRSLEALDGLLPEVPRDS